MLTFQYPVLLLIAALCCQSCCLIIHFGAVTRRCNYVTGGGGRQLSCEKGSFLKSRNVCNSDLSYVQGRSVTLPVISSSNNFLHTTTQFLCLQIPDLNSQIQSCALLQFTHCTVLAVSWCLTTESVRDFTGLPWRRIYSSDLLLCGFVTNYQTTPRHIQQLVPNHPPNHLRKIYS